jgi:DOPA 4,5-dioxygenase
VSAPLSPTRITGYHAHIYFSDDTRADAAWLRTAVLAHFEIRLGRMWNRPVGPHPEPMFQIAFDTELFERIVPWLMLNRRGLNVLVHPETGDDVADHDVYPLWLGEKLALDIEGLRRAVPQTASA